MLTSFAEEIWLASGSAVAVAGFRYPTRMAVIRLSGRRLLVWSPVALTDELRSATRELGEVSWLVAPNTLHHLFIAAWHQAWPEAELLAPPGLRRKRPDLRIARDLTEEGEAPWSGEIDHAVVDGRIATEVVFFHRRSRTVLFADLLQQFDRGWFAGWRGVVARLDGLTGAAPRMPRKFRLALFGRRSAQAALLRIGDWPAERAVMAHGTPVSRDAQTVVRRALRS